VKLTDGRVMVRGKLAARIRNPEAKGGPKRADFVLYARPTSPIAVVEAKQARFAVGHGMQQALVYAEMLDAPFAISSNGDGFLLHDRTGLTQPLSANFSSASFPPGRAVAAVPAVEGLAEPEAVKPSSSSLSTPTAAAASRATTSASPSTAPSKPLPGQQRVLLVMATGTGKTYTAFPDHLAPVEGQGQEAHPLPGGPQHPG
jgi:type I restriction enzyme R subunit